MSESVPSWEDVETIILVDNHGVTYSLSKIRLLKLIKGLIADMLPDIWRMIVDE